jgi:hypothetical protein
LGVNLTVEESIETLLEKLEHRHLSTAKATLYARQVEAKFKNARYSLGKLREFGLPVATGSSTASSVLLGTDELINFYCDCFWDFLRSSIDILAQLINERTSLGMGERDVDIKKVEAHPRLASFAQLKTSVKYLLNLKVFKKLEQYRHCSMHRRQVYIKTMEQKVSILGTRGYSATTSDTEMPTYVSYLCRDPQDLTTTPDVDDSRTVDMFCQELLEKLQNQMVAIINRLP